MWSDHTRFSFLGLIIGHFYNCVNSACDIILLEPQCGHYDFRFAVHVVCELGLRERKMLLKLKSNSIPKVYDSQINIYDSMTHDNM